MVGAVTIRPLTLPDLPAAAQVHRLAFPRSSLTRLGKEAVRRYYEWQMVGPHELIALGAFCDGELAGFSFGGVFNGALVGFLRRNQGYLLLLSLSRPWLFTDELFRARFQTGFAMITRRFRPKSIPVTHSYSSPEKRREFGILSIAVNPNYQGQGIGKQLMLLNEQNAVEQGFDCMGLNVATDNEQAIGFYQSLGWQKKMSAEGIWKGKMTKIVKIGISSC